ncbi:MAG: response regulator, partial [Pedobacter sp.]|nr:response regulator [Pedobacter sp.]
FEALQMLSKGAKYDVIMMDYHMPFMDGLETIKKIRDSFYATAAEQPIIMLHSSSDDGKIIQACEELKVGHRLVKPLKMQDVYHALTRLHRKEPEQQIPEKTGNQTAVDRFTVLVAEDNMVNMLLARTIIKKFAPNADLIEAKNGVEAVKYCEQKMPNLVLMDVQMPEMNGYEATKAIRAINPAHHIPIIALTAGNVKGEKEKCLAAGMDDFVVKPVVEETIIGIFNKWLDLNNQQDSLYETLMDEPDAAHFNFNKLKSYLGDDDAILEEALALIKAELSSSLETIQKHVDAGDLAALKIAGHKLYGTAVSSGLHLLSRMANELEQLRDFDPNKSSALFDVIEKEIKLVLKLIDDRN